LHTLWTADDAKEVLLAIIKEPKLSVFAAIRSKWGHGLEIKKAVDAHIEGMYDSGDAEPSRGDDEGLFGMLQETRDLAEELLKAKEFDAAFFFAHAVAEMIRRCEADDAEDQPELVEEWAKALDALMVDAVTGWRARSGKGAQVKKDAATMVKLLDEGERAKKYDQSKWYPKTLKQLRAWAK
jgi:hypothetical protein